MLREDYTFCRACGAGADHAMPVSEPQPEMLPEPEFVSPPAAPPAKSKSTMILIAAIAVLATLVLVVGFLVLEQEFAFIGMFGERQPAVTQENNNDETTLPADEIQSNDSTLQNQLGLPPTPAMFYTTANLHLRAAPSTQAQSIVVVAAGTRVNVVHYYNANWFRVRRGNDVGYMSSEFLSQTRQ